MAVCAQMQLLVYSSEGHSDWGTVEVQVVNFSVILLQILLYFVICFVVQGPHAGGVLKVSQEQLSVGCSCKYLCAFDISHGFGIWSGVQMAKADVALG